MIKQVQYRKQASGTTLEAFPGKAGARRPSQGRQGRGGLPWEGRGAEARGLCVRELRRSRCDWSRPSRGRRGLGGEGSGADGMGTSAGVNKQTRKA